MSTRLTKSEKAAVVAILNERLAGGVSDLADALGLDDKEADKMMEAAESAAVKLSDLRKEKK